MTPQPMATRNLYWFTQQLSFSYSIVRTNPSFPTPLYRMQLSTPVRYNRDGVGWVTFSPSAFSNPIECELQMCTELGWFYYNPGVSYGKACETRQGIFGTTVRRVDLRWTKLVP